MTSMEEDQEEEYLSAGPVVIEEEEFEQASDGLEYKVVELYMEKYNKGEIRSIVKGSSRKMDLANNTVYLDKTLMAYNGLGFFHGKYPEFLIAQEDSVVTPDNLLFSNTEINCELFEEGTASDYLMKRDNYQFGDLQLMISKAFYYKGAYYVHAWEMSNSTEIFHHQRITYKFDKNGDIIDEAGINTAQVGYGRAKQYLKDQNTLGKIAYDL